MDRDLARHVGSPAVHCTTQTGILRRDGLAAKDLNCHRVNMWDSMPKRRSVRFFDLPQMAFASDIHSAIRDGWRGLHQFF